MGALADAEVRLRVERPEPGLLVLRVSGDWTLDAGMPDADEVVRDIESDPPSRVRFDASGLGRWDTALVAYVYRVVASAVEGGAAVDLSSLPEGVRTLVGIARVVPHAGAARPPEDDALTARVGRVALRAWDTMSDAVAFLGETVIAFAAVLGGRARFRRVDLLHALETTGAGALGIVALINFLIGAVLAFVGAVQLAQFGAEIYVADLVGIGITRELGALMTGIVMCGRTGAAFAAVLGTMTVNEEVDALRTMGLKPVEFLVVPRVLATGLMLPALVAYADLLGVLGGGLVGVSLLGLGAVEFVEQLRSALPLRHVLVGLVKGGAFGIVVALAGCYYGIRCGRSAAAVGEATTRAVVSGIVFVVVVDAAFTVALHVAGL